MVLFQAVSVPVNGTGTYSGLALFQESIGTAEVCLRGLNLQNYTDGSLWHYRGVTEVQIASVSVGTEEVQFSFNFNFSEGSSYQMAGSIDFLVIANSH